MSEAPELTPKIPNLMDGLFLHLLDFTAREAVEIACTKTDEIISADDAEKMARITCDMIRKQGDIAVKLCERVRAFLSVE